MDYYSRDALLEDHLIALAKASFSHTSLLTRLNQFNAKDYGPKVLNAFWKQKNERKDIERIFLEDRFLNFRQLYSALTDEAIENKVAWLIEALGKSTFPLKKEEINNPISSLPFLLQKLGDVFLVEGHDKTLRVHSHLLEKWQDLILVVPPLLIIAGWLTRHCPAPTKGSASYNSLCVTYYTRIQHLLCDSTLPIDNNPFMDHLCRDIGLEETHMHLNGTTEAEKVWVDGLKNHQKIIAGLTHNSSSEGGISTPIGNGVARLLKQEEHALTPKILHNRIIHAAALKSYLLETSENNSFNAQEALSEGDLAWSSRYLKAIRTPAYSNLHITAREAIRLTSIIDRLTSKESSSFEGICFFFYVLVRAQFCRLLVQQSNQNGFDQFQYITNNDLREETEKTYTERFRQIERGTQKSISFLEGRFAPKVTPEKNANILYQILRGYSYFLNETPQGKSRDNPKRNFCGASQPPISLKNYLDITKDFEAERSERHTQRRLRLGLTAHFIKKQATNKRKVPTLCRNSNVRCDADRSARALLKILDQTPGLYDLISGIDAASNERHASPEAFAPVFRRMYRKGIKRKTYHVGEDFCHLAAGIRAINEAVFFLDLSSGCRIGHGTAAGLNPQHWWDAVGGRIVQPCEDRLDDLVFAWGTLKEKALLLDRLPLLDEEIKRLASYIWNDTTLTPDLLYRAWKLRYLDPLVQDYHYDDPAIKYDRYYDVDSNRRQEKLLHKKAMNDFPAYQHYLKRHQINKLKKQDYGPLSRSQELIPIRQEDNILTIEILSTLQELTISLLQERHIAIETLPSSNIRISIHKNYADHHITNWLGYGHLTHLPNIVVGSDDPGIFATSLRMEYAHLFRALTMLQTTQPLPHINAEDILKRLCATAQQYRFS